MNYIQELNAFYDRLETNPLSSSAIALWHALMSVNNKAGWIEEFAVAASVLCMKSGLKDSMFKKARNELSQKGYIQFKSRGGNQSALYKMTSLWSQYDHTGVHSSVHNGIRNGVHSSDQLLNKTKLNNHNPHHAHTREENPISVYEQEIGRFTDMIRDNMLDWLSGEYFDEPDGIMIAAIREAAVHEKRSWSYVERVLQACLRENVRTVAQFEEKKQAFQARKQQEQAKPKHRHLHVVRNEELKEKPVVEREPIDLLEMGG